MRSFFLIILLCSIGSKELVYGISIIKSENLYLVDDTQEIETESENQDFSEEDMSSEYYFDYRFLNFSGVIFRISPLHRFSAWKRSSFLEIHSPPPELVANLSCYFSRIAE